MSEASESKLDEPRQLLNGGLLLVMGGLAIVFPFVLGREVLSPIGLLLILSGILEMIQIWRAPSDAARRASYVGGGLSILGGLALLSDTVLILKALTLFLSASFLLDGFTKMLTAMLGRATGNWALLFGIGLANLLLGISLWGQWPLAGYQAIGIAVGLRMLTLGWSVLSTPTPPAVVEPEAPIEDLHPDGRLRLPAHAELGRWRTAYVAGEETRRPIDAYWCLMFFLTFFAIHVGRMSAEWNLVGLLSPGVAAVGDVATALLIAFGIILPVHLAWRRVTRPVERRGWAAELARVDAEAPLGWRQQLIRFWLLVRYHFSARMAEARTSPRASLRWALQVGLPPTAILIATNPIWGFSWYFNSENWASEVWNRWAESRTDTWREAMTEAVRQQAGLADDRLFRIEPPDVAGQADFSFLVIGDPGEGDPSQHCLRDQYLKLGEQPAVKFLVVASDVIYPAGAMKDYEPNFYLPFKGFTKPIYAVPGNHDWFDALEGFNANLLEPAAARAALRARVAADLRLTTTTEGRIDLLVDEAARLRQAYGIQAGQQRGPYFEIQTERFALIAVDSGVLKRVDPPQGKWLQAALERARGKFIMVILGHPLYAAGHDQTVGEPAFAALHQLLRDHEVDIVMAGDTHDFEYYREAYAGAPSPHPLPGGRGQGEGAGGGGARTMHHFVNGGGGAYLSIGTALDWPKKPALPDCAIYPRTDALRDKLDRETPFWKQPLWFWVKHLSAWPSSVEAMGGAFDYNRAPFFQSFVEVRIEGSTNTVRIVPYSANGRLHWRDLQVVGQVIPEGQGEDELAEFVMPMRAK